MSVRWGQNQGTDIFHFSIGNCLFGVEDKYAYTLLARSIKDVSLFIAGHYFAQYRLLSKGCLKKQWGQPAAILLYILTIAVAIKTNFHIVNLTGIFAIVILLNLFETHSEMLRNDYPWLENIVGRYMYSISSSCRRCRIGVNISYVVIVLTKISFRQLWLARLLRSLLLFFAYLSLRL